MVGVLTPRALSIDALLKALPASGPALSSSVSEPQLNWFCRNITLTLSLPWWKLRCHLVTAWLQPFSGPSTPSRMKPKFLCRPRKALVVWPCGSPASSLSQPLPLGAADGEGTWLSPLLSTLLNPSPTWYLLLTLPLVFRLRYQLFQGNIPTLPSLKPGPEHVYQLPVWNESSYREPSWVLHP